MLWRTRRVSAHVARACEPKYTAPAAKCEIVRRPGRWWIERAGIATASACPVIAVDVRFLAIEFLAIERTTGDVPRNFQSTAVRCHWVIQ